MGIHRILHSVLAIPVILALAPVPVSAGSVSRSVPFELDEWIELEASDGPVTLHRLRIEEIRGGLTKSKLFRPGNDEYLETIRIELVYSNEADRDWEADLDIRWLDDQGRAIDGYHDEEDLDDDERHEDTTVTLSTLRYGLDRAETLEIGIEFYPD
ncbi:MAG: hypothetical protein R3234_05210 [Thermoanaerobaculia bacterium]|nr:hypothetical protein [Thermoanaerobaculia bacterium]